MIIFYFCLTANSMSVVKSGDDLSQGHAHGQGQGEGQGGGQGQDGCDMSLQTSPTQVSELKYTIQCCTV